MTEVSGNLHLTIAAYSLQPSNLALLYTLVISAGNSFNVPPDRTQFLTKSNVATGIEPVSPYCSSGASFLARRSNQPLVYLGKGISWVVSQSTPLPWRIQISVPSHDWDSYPCTNILASTIRRVALRRMQCSLYTRCRPLA